ncbi:MAG: death-on-curing protein [Pseudomonadota bacterium]
MAGAPVRFEPHWVRPDVALALHDRQLAEHGGPVGLRDQGVFESAMARARNRWEYGENDRAALAAAYAYGIARNHPFVDGNKRTAWVLARLFLALNGISLTFAPHDAINMAQGLAGGTVSEEALAQWFRAHSLEG